MPLNKIKRSENFFKFYQEVNQKDATIARQRNDSQVRRISPCMGLKALVHSPYAHRYPMSLSVTHENDRFSLGTVPRPAP